MQKTTFNAPQTDILKYEHSVKANAIIKTTGAKTRSDGSKYLPAGTLLKGTLGTGITTPMEAAVTTSSASPTVVTAAATSAKCVLFNDVNFTAAPGTTTLRNGSGSVVIHGFIDVNKLPNLGGLDATNSKVVYGKLALDQIKFL